MANTKQTTDTTAPEAPAQPTQVYWVGDYNVSVEASSPEEAVKKAKALKEPKE